MDGGDGLGGTCLNVGCIPSKAIIHAASKFETVSKAANGGTLGITVTKPAIDLQQTVAWKDGIVRKLNNGVAALLKKAKVKVIKGWATFADAKTCTVKTGDGDITITAEHVILATGSDPVELPFLKFGGDVISSTEALSLDAVPNKLVVVGGGYIGLELGIAFRKLGPRSPSSRWPTACCRSTTRPSPTRSPNGWRSTASNYTSAPRPARSRRGSERHDQGRPGHHAEGRQGAGHRRPQAAHARMGGGLENMGVAMAGPFVKIDDRCATSMKNVWAVGDLTGEPMLAHKGSAQGEVVAEIIAGHDRRFDPVTIAAVCFTEPRSSPPAWGRRTSRAATTSFGAVFP